MLAARVWYEGVLVLLAARTAVERFVVRVRVLDLVDAAFAGGEMHTLATAKVRPIELPGAAAENAGGRLLGIKVFGVHVRLVRDGKARVFLDHPRRVLATARALVHRLLGAQVVVLVLRVADAAQQRRASWAAHRAGKRVDVLKAHRACQWLRLGHRLGFGLGLGRGLGPGLGLAVSAWSKQCIVQGRPGRL